MPRTLLCHQIPNGISETFIRAHAQGLNQIVGEVSLRGGKPLLNGSRILAPDNFFHTIYRKAFSGPQIDNSQLQR